MTAWCPPTKFPVRAVFSSGQTEPPARFVVVPLGLPANRGFASHAHHLRTNYTTMCAGCMGHQKKWPITGAGIFAHGPGLPAVTLPLLPRPCRAASVPVFCVKTIQAGPSEGLFRVITVRSEMMEEC